jgi:hypothetical protein
MQEGAAMTMHSETRSTAGVLHITRTNGSDAFVPCSGDICPQNDDTGLAEAVVSPIQALFVASGITIGNLCFVATVALFIRWYAL